MQNALNQNPKPINGELVSEKLINEILNNLNIIQFENCSIREIKILIDEIENKTGINFIRLDMGVPRNKPLQLMLDAEIDAILNKNVTGTYPDISGDPKLKIAMSQFAKKFLEIDINSTNCIPTVGSINGAFLATLVALRRDPLKNTILFLDPGFPTHKQMIKMQGFNQVSFDIYNYRGEKLRKELEKIIVKNNISAILFSNPNNPTWMTLNEQELAIIGEVASTYDVIVIEDLAYFGMGLDRSSLSVQHYTPNAITLVSTSKVFNYPGQRIGMMFINDKLANKKYHNLSNYFSNDQFIHCLIYDAIYASTAGCAHSAQIALTSLLNELNRDPHLLNQSYVEIETVSKQVKEIFLRNGFLIPYEIDKDGYYFTFSYPGFSGEALAKKLISFGIGSFPLLHTGADKIEGVRASVSKVSSHDLILLEIRLALFHKNHSL